MTYINSEQSQARKIGDILKENLKLCNKTQKDLAEETGIPQTTISSYVRGVSIPSFENLGKICKVLNISMDIFNAIKENKLPKESLNSAVEHLNSLTLKHFIEWLAISESDLKLHMPLELLKDSIDSVDLDDDSISEDEKKHRMLTKVFRVATDDDMFVNEEPEECYILKETVSNEKARELIKDMQAYARNKIEEYLKENALDNIEDYL